MVPRAPCRSCPAARSGCARPARNTDAQDLLYAGHIATIAACATTSTAPCSSRVTIDDDPAAELHDWYGRYHYYRLDEVEPL